MSMLYTLKMLVYQKRYLMLLKNTNITKYVVADASLNEIFIHYVGGKNE